MAFINRIGWIGVFLVFMTPVVTADSGGERAALAQIIHELDAIMPLVAVAQAHANLDTRVQFQYDWLALDIERMKLGIKEHLTAPRQARTLPPLKGDYRR